MVLLYDNTEPYDTISYTYDGELIQGVIIEIRVQLSDLTSMAVQLADDQALATPLVDLNVAVESLMDVTAQTESLGDDTVIRLDL